MPTASYSVNVAAGGISIGNQVQRTGDGPIGLQTTLPVAVAGTLTTRTDNDTGVVTVASHGITTSDKVDVYWSGGRRYNMTVTATTSTTISIDVGSGDNLPIATTAVTIQKATIANLLIDGDNASIVAMVVESTDVSSTTKAQVTLKDSSAAIIAHITLDANVPQVWDITGGSANPFTGNVIYTACCTNGSSSETLTLKIVGMQDATP